MTLTFIEAVAGLLTLFFCGALAKQATEKDHLLLKAVCVIIFGALCWFIGRGMFLTYAELFLFD